MKKKILFIITYLELGGAQKQLLDTIKNINKKKYDIYLYAGPKGYLKDKFLFVSGANVKLDYFLVRKINLFKDLIVLFRIFYFIKGNKFDIVHTHSPKASFLGRWAAFFSGVDNIIYTVHGWPFHEYMNKFMYYFYFYLEKISAKITKRILVVSKADLRIGLDSNIAPRDKFCLLHYGVEVDKFKGVLSSRLSNVSANMILTISALKQQKGIFDFINIASLLLRDNPKLKFIILGDGPLNKRVKEKINEIGLENNIFLEGWSYDIIPFLKQANIFILMSLWEGLPVALIEAVISGIPVVVTDTGGVSDIVKSGKQGLIIKPKDILGASKACTTILKNYNNWSKMVNSNILELDLEHWSTNRMINDLENLYAAV